MFTFCSRELTCFGFSLSLLNPRNSVLLFFCFLWVFFFYLQLGSRHNKLGETLVHWQGIKRLLMLILKDVIISHFVKQHCLRTRRVLAIMMGHNKQSKMHCSSRWFTLLRSNLSINQFLQSLVDIMQPPANI